MRGEPEPHLWRLLSAPALAADGPLLHAMAFDHGASLSLTGPELITAAERTAGGVLALLGRGPRRVGLLMANGEPWLRSFLAVLRLDAAAVPLALPWASAGGQAYFTHLRKVADAAELDAVLIDVTLNERVRTRLVEAFAATGTPVLAVGDGVTAVPAPGEPERTGGRTPGTAYGLPGGLPAARRGGAEPAVLQYTSGSTSAPKGVVLSHRSVAAGLDSIVTTARWTPRDTLGTWLPLFHDMGLFFVLAALYRGGAVRLWQPQDFARRPMKWLGQFAATGCTVSVGPDFFYDRLTQVAARGIPEDLDLTAWRYGANGSEQIRMPTLREFHRTYEPYGLAPRVLQTGYGLAEATLMVTARPPRSAWRSVTVDRTRLGVGDRIGPATAGDPSARTLVSCGPAVTGVRVRVGDDEGNPLPEGTVGEVQVAGDAVTSGYLGLPAAGQPFTSDGHLRTGDIGFLLDGELHIAGRLKAMVVVRGQNYYAEDVEEIVRTTPGVDRRHCAAFVCDTGDGTTDAAPERMVVLWETRQDEAEAAEVGKAVRHRLSTELGLGDVEVHAMPPASLPHTSSGKVKRSGAADLYRRERLGVG